MPPHSYCSAYSSLPEFLSITETETQYPIRPLFEAATTPVALCPVTGFSIVTPFQAMVWAQRLAATRYPNVAAAVTLIKCLRVGVDLGFRGDRSRFQAGPNLPTAASNASAVVDSIQKESKTRCLR